eukprot:COSAG01_NODE_1381_length_10520_cov_2.661710_3_plen_92_part_00
MPLCDAAAQISAGRQARARSTSSPGEPAAVWRSTEYSYAGHPCSPALKLYKVQQFRCYRSGLRRLLGEYSYGGIEAEQTAGCGWPVAAATD